MSEAGESTTAAPAPETVVLDGYTVHCTSEQDGAFIWAEVVELGSYDPAARFLSPGDTVLDVGAHFGFVSMRLSSLVGPLRVVACEPAPPTFACLEANLRDHVPGGTALRVAVGAAPGQAELTYYTAPGSSALSTVTADEADFVHNVDAFMANSGLGGEPAARLAAARAVAAQARTFTVPVVTVSDLVAEHDLERVDLLKIDVERAELDVLRGVDDDLWPRIRTVVMEVHDVGDNRALVDALLAAHGFVVEYVEQAGPLRGTSVHELIARRETA